MKILANDGIAPIGKEKLEQAGYQVVTETVAQKNLIDAIDIDQLPSSVHSLVDFSASFLQNTRDELNLKTG